MSKGNNGNMRGHLATQHMRKAEEDYQMRMRARKVMEKFDSSGKAVEDFMKDQAHDLMLKQELRKLREDDMRK